jgi:hypothetical protein
LQAGHSINPGSPQTDGCLGTVRVRLDDGRMQEASFFWDSFKQAFYVMTDPTWLDFFAGQGALRCFIYQTDGINIE